MVRHNLSPMKSFLFEEEGILGQKEKKWKGESYVVSAQDCLGRKLKVWERM